jgi:hypothetical protein
VSRAKLFSRNKILHFKENDKEKYRFCIGPEKVKRSGYPKRLPEDDK